MAIKSRIFNIMQYENHPETGEPLLCEEQIKSALAHRTIKRWAYICHDKDVYSALDEEQDPKHIQGNFKPRHWHIVIEMGSNQVEIGVIAKWLKIADNWVNVAKGAGAFLDCVEYLTHEDEKQQGLGKRLYEDREVKANFDFREELDKRAERKARYGKDLSDKDMVRNEVLYHGMTLQTVIDKYPLIYQDDMLYLEKCRLRYISKVSEMPDMRMNFYIEGRGGIGKGLISKAIARAVVDREGVLSDDEIFFEVGADKTSFEGYDGQPVIIWNDCRAFTLLQKLGGRENVFNVFDMFPPDVKQNIKYGSIRLTNKVNIVNSVQPWTEFLDGLSGEYKDSNGVIRKSEDKGQGYRRFPFFVRLHEEDYDLGMNKGVFEGTREYTQYLMYKHITGNFQRVVEACGSNMTLVNSINGKALEPVISKYDELRGRLAHEQKASDEDILAMFADYGKPKVSDDGEVSHEGIRPVEEGSAYWWYNHVFGKHADKEVKDIPKEYLEEVQELYIQVKAVFEKDRQIVLN